MAKTHTPAEREIMLNALHETAKLVNDGKFVALICGPGHDIPLAAHTEIVRRLVNSALAKAKVK